MTAPNTTVKMQSRQNERDSEGVSRTVVYQGTQEEMLVVAERNIPGQPGEIGRVRATRVYQDAANLWNCEIRAETDFDGETTSEPDTAYGKKSASLRGSRLSMDLATHPNYRTCWDHYLAAAPDVADTPPANWNQATTELISGAENAKKYKWVKSLSEAPQTKEGLWRAITVPEMPGVVSYDLAAYGVTESARFHSPNAAGRMVAGKLNKVGAPSTDFGVSDGCEWKCDDATVSWTGKYWLATLTWTRSGDSRGWNRKLYDEAT